MGAVWVRARAELRRGWQATVVLAVLVGVVGGVTMFGVAGARRTASAMDRFIDYHRPFDAFVFGGEELDMGAVERLPPVVDTDLVLFFMLVPSTPTGEPDPDGPGLNPFGSTRGTFGVTSERPLVVAGHPPDPGQAHHVAINEQLAEDNDLVPGDALRVWSYRPDQFFAELEAPGDTQPAGPALDLTVSGVVRMPRDVSPEPTDESVTALSNHGLFLTPAFVERYADELAHYGPLLGPILMVRLTGGAGDLPAFTEAVRALPGGQAADIQPNDTPLMSSRTQRATDIQALALLAFAVAVGVAGMLVVGQTLARQVAVDAGAGATLRALGLTSNQLVGATVVRALLVGMAGAALSVALALALSPLSPVGLAGAAEVNPGVSADLAVLVLGAGAVVVAVTMRVALAAWRAAPASTTGPEGRTTRPSRLAERLAGAGVPASAVAGVRMALEPGRAAAAVPVRTALGGTAIAAAAVAAGLAFSASLDHLVATPALQGWTWDVTVGDETVDIHDRGIDLLRANPVVAGFTARSGTGYRMQVQGREISVIGLESVRGDVGPEVSTGRMPEEADEVALGARTLDRLGVEVGDEIVAVGDTGGARTLTVVGSGLLGPAVDYTVGIGEGAVTTLDGMAELFGDVPTGYFLVDYAAGVDPDAAFNALQADWGRQVVRPLAVPEVENLRRVSGLPLVFSVLLAALAVATLGHALVTTVQRRSRDLAVLKALGFARRQLAATVAWQSSTLVVGALAVGLPLGIAAGRWGWSVVADSIGAPAPAVTPVLVVLGTVPVALAIANVAAAFPAHQAARTRPATVLRSE
jgi:ABC-type lipoprotein release transport system permease subunit